MTGPQSCSGPMVVLQTLGNGCTLMTGTALQSHMIAIYDLHSWLLKVSGEALRKSQVAIMLILNSVSMAVSLKFT